MDYILIKGVVRDLNVVEGYEDLAPSKSLQSGAATLGIVTAALESPLSSPALASSRNSAVIKMDFFTCSVGNFLLRGAFYSVGFENGDDMEFVVRKAGQVHDVRGACCVSQQIIWTLPYRSRGHEAQKRFDLFRNVLFSAIFGCLFSIIWNWKSAVGQVGSSYFVTFLIGSIMMLVLGAAVRRNFYEFSHEATKVFEVLGFSDPENVDLPKNHKKANRAFLGAARARNSLPVPWQYRYEMKENP